MPQNRLEVGLALTEDSLVPGLKRAADAHRGFVAGFGKTTDAMDRQTGRALRSITRLTSSMFSLRTAMLAVGSAYAGNKFFSFAGQLEDIDNAFKNLNRSLGNDSIQTLESLRRATRNTVSDFNLMQVSNRAFLLGSAKTTEQLEVLSTVARRLGRAMGTEITASFDDIALAMGRLSPRILDNLGIIVSIEFANQRYAEAVGKTVEELTEAEKRQAFMNNTMEAAKRLLGFLGQDVKTLSDDYGKFKALLANTAADILKALNPAYKSLFKGLITFIEESRPRLYAFLADLIEISETVVGVIGALFRTIGPIIASVFGGVISGVNSLLKVTVQTVEVRVAEMARRLARERGLYADDETQYRTGNVEYFGRRGLPGERATGGVRAQGVDVLIERIRASNKTTAEELRELEKLIRERDTLREQVDRLDKLGRGDFPEANSSAFEQAASALRRRAEELSYPTYGPTLEQLGIKEGELKFPEETFLPESFTSSVKTTERPGFSPEGPYAGLLTALDEVATKSRDTFTIMRNSVLDVADAVTNNLTDGLVDLVTGTATLKEAFRSMATGILEDLARILIRMALVRIIGFGIGLFSDSLQGGRREIPASLDDSVYSPDGLVPPRTGDVTSLDPPEPLLDLSGSRNLVGENLGDRVSAGGGATIINIQTIDAKSFDEYFRQSTARQPEVVGLTSMRQFQENKTVRRGYGG